MHFSQQVGKNVVDLLLFYMSILFLVYPNRVLHAGLVVLFLFFLTFVSCFDILLFVFYVAFSLILVHTSKTKLISKFILGKHTHTQVAHISTISFCAVKTGIAACHLMQIKQFKQQINKCVENKFAVKFGTIPR